MLGTRLVRPAMRQAAGAAVRSPCGAPLAAPRARAAAPPHRRRAGAAYATGGGKRPEDKSWVEIASEAAGVAK
jgi:hypothetical protein